jgi:hypothetical protein
MERECSLLHSQVPANCPYSQPANPVHSPTSYFLKNHLSIILPSTPGSSSGVFPSGFPTKTLYASPLPHTRYMPCPSHSSRFDHPNNTGWGVQIKLLIMQFPPLPRHLVPLRHKYSSTYSQTPSAYVPPSISATKFHTHIKQQVELQFCIF